MVGCMTGWMHEWLDASVKYGWNRDEDAGCADR